ncbi:hypothetical protein B5F07_09875 [Lachnoclostridium sp. An169]|nr:hypothetical protein B5F07_09875 [Lachnoclostridium sp. An169]
MTPLQYRKNPTLHNNYFIDKLPRHFYNHRYQGNSFYDSFRKDAMVLRTGLSKSSLHPGSVWTTR